MPYKDYIHKSHYDLNIKSVISNRTNTSSIHHPEPCWRRGRQQFLIGISMKGESQHLFGFHGEKADLKPGQDPEVSTYLGFMRKVLTLNRGKIRKSALIWVSWGKCCQVLFCV